VCHKTSVPFFRLGCLESTTLLRARNHYCNNRLRGCHAPNKKQDETIRSQSGCLRTDVCVANLLIPLDLSIASFHVFRGLFGRQGEAERRKVTRTSPRMTNKPCTWNLTGHRAHYASSIRMYAASLCRNTCSGTTRRPASDGLACLVLFLMNW